MTRLVNTRELILETLIYILRDGEYSHIAIRNTLDKYQYLEQQERKYIKRVCEGTIENLIHIDYIIEKFSSVKINKMKVVIRNILRYAVYEIKYMDAVPVSASCNEAVKLAKKKGFHNLKGFLNGVLRTITRNIDSIEYPDKEKDALMYMSIIYSMPMWILSLWEKTYSLEEIEEFLQSFLTKKGTSIRVNTSRISVEDLKREFEKEHINVIENESLPYGLFISGYDTIEKMAAFQKGYFYPQDTSSMMVIENSGLKEHDYVIDVCAAPGGKSMHAADCLKGTGTVEARDLTQYKVELIQENIIRSSYLNIKAVQADARELIKDSIEKADVVIADLPCSGLGVIGKKSDIKYKMTEKKLAQLAGLQKEILHTVSFYVKPLGTLVYSTCTINSEENEKNIQWFLKEHPTFTLIKETLMLPKGGKNDGFYIARLQQGNAHE